MALLTFVAFGQLVVSLLILAALQDQRGSDDPTGQIDRLQSATLRDLFAAEAMARRESGSDIIDSTAREMRR